MIIKKITNDEFNKTFDWDHIGSSIVNSINTCEPSDSDSKNLLLNYPVVYVHIWKDDTVTSIYIGETIDIKRRTEEHSNNDGELQDWQTSWKDTDKNTKYSSYIITSKVMNKSLSLDLEDRLIKSLKNAFPDEGDVKIRNGRHNKQGNYSNKIDADPMMKNILKYLQNELNKEFDIEAELKDENQCIDNNQSVELCPNILYGLVINWKGKITKEALSGDIENVLNEKLLPAVKEYPAIYVHAWKTKTGDKWKVYTGESEKIIERTKQHFESVKDENDEYEWNETWHDEWKEAINCGEAYMFVFCHSQMNKSITLDVEDQLITYNKLLGNSVNRRQNPQREYGNKKEYMKSIFREIVDILVWNMPCKDNPFIPLETVNKRSIFMASPFLDLSNQQKKAIEKVKNCINENNSKKLIIIEGGAGTGKTVVASKLFFDLIEAGKKVVFLNNHEELMNVYQAQAKANYIGTEASVKEAIKKAEEYINGIKLKWLKKLKEAEPVKVDLILQLPDLETYGDVSSFEEDCKKIMTETNVKCENPYMKIGDEVIRAQCFDKPKELGVGISKKFSWELIKELYKEAKLKNLPIDTDIAIVDEAHLLLCKGGLGVKEGQLPIIVENANITVLFFDKNQYVNKGTNIEQKETEKATNNTTNQLFAKYLEIKESQIEVVELSEQFRMQCSDDLSKWLKELFLNDQQIKTINSKNITKTEKNNYISIKEKQDNGDDYEIRIYSSLKNLIDLVQEKKEKDNPSEIVATYCWDYGNNKKTGRKPFVIEELEFVWHTTGGSEIGENLIWTKRNWVMNSDKKYEIGAIHDIQGFDLNYVGVIIGEAAVGYDNGKVIIKNKRNDLNGTGNKEGILLIENEIKVLLTRGIKGVYIYVEDEVLREALMAACLK